MMLDKVKSTLNDFGRAIIYVVSLILFIAILVVTILAASKTADDGEFKLCADMVVVSHAAEIRKDGYVTDSMAEKISEEIGQQIHGRIKTTESKKSEFANKIIVDVEYRPGISFSGRKCTESVVISVRQGD